MKCCDYHNSERQITPVYFKFHNFFFLLLTCKTLVSFNPWEHIFLLRAVFRCVCDYNRVHPNCCRLGWILFYSRKNGAETEKKQFLLDVDKSDKAPMSQKTFLRCSCYTGDIYFLKTSNNLRGYRHKNDYNAITLSDTCCLKGVCFYAFKNLRRLWHFSATILIFFFFSFSYHFSVETQRELTIYDAIRVNYKNKLADV